MGRIRRDGSLIPVAEYFNKDKNYFNVVKHVSREKFDFMMSFDKNPTNSVIKYTEYIDNLLAEAVKYRYKFERPKDFGEFVLKYKLTSGKRRENYLVMDRHLFKYYDDYLSMQFAVVKKLQKMVDICRDYKFPPTKAELIKQEEDLIAETGLKNCRICGKTKKITSFYDNGTGVGGYSNVCGECTRERSQKNYRRRHPNAKTYKKAPNRATQGAYVI